MPERRKFEPHKDYDCLKIQAYALDNLLRIHECEIKILREKYYEFEREKMSANSQRLKSEISMNEILTNENEKLESLNNAYFEKIQKLRAALELAKTMIINNDLDIPITLETINEALNDAEPTR